MSRLHLKIAVRWFDLDAYGHVNNAEMFRILEEARIRAFWAPPEEQRVNGLPDAILRVSADIGGDTITLIARHEIEYKAPLNYRWDGVDVELWVSKVGGSSLDVSYLVSTTDADDVKTVYALAESTIVLVDAATNRPRRLTDSEREAVEHYREDPNPLRSKRRPS